MAASPPEKLQNMPPKWAHFCLGVEKFIHDKLDVELAGRRIVVAFSHGADSTALLVILNALGRKTGFKVVAAHLDHGLRPESGEEARLSESFCAGLGVDFHVEAADVSGYAKEKGLGLEEAGRELRYAFLERVRRKEDAQYLAVGHHLNDLAEDVLMRLGRGTGWPGLSGMDGFDSARSLIRPLLLVPKHQLIEFLQDLSVSWIEDMSNADVAYRRNRVRGELLPLFLKENPNFLQTVKRLWRQGRDDEKYWSMKIADFPVRDRDGVLILSSDHLSDTSPAFRLRLYKSVLDRLGAGQVLAESLFSLDRAWVEGKVGSRVQFPGNKLAKLVAEGVEFCKDH